MNSIRSLLNRTLILRNIIHNESQLNQIIKRSSTVQQQLNNKQLNKKQLKEKDGEKNGTIYVTESAINRLKKVLNQNEVLRISIDSGGCKGFNYLFKVDETIDKNDKIFEIDNSKIVIDRESYDFLKECVLDYNDELIKSSFRIQENPQNTESCSCGISFSPKIF